MRKITTTLLSGLLGLGFGLAGSLVPSEATAIVFCAKTNNPSRVKVRGDACRARETEVSVLDNPEVQSELGALGDGLKGVLRTDDIYVVTRTHGPVGLLGTVVLCEDGDVATGGGVTSNSHGSSGPFVSYSGPLLDEFDKPIGWRIGIHKVSSDIEIHVICAGVRRPSFSPPTDVPSPLPPRFE